jgi:hypothetical protein
VVEVAPGWQEVGRKAGLWQDAWEVIGSAVEAGGKDPVLSVVTATACNVIVGI